MTMGWHMMLGFSPALFDCYIWEENHRYQMLRSSKECVINLPTLGLFAGQNLAWFTEPKLACPS
jgi:flavin reductase (DIM6/NTAB) family NADH-FMN oxidoreductase RutF